MASHVATDGGGAVVAELKNVASIAGVGGVGGGGLTGATLGSSGLPLDSHVASPADNTKGLKMKIKRKSVNSTGGSQRHEIVSEDDAPPPKSKKAKDRDRDRDKESNSAKDSGRDSNAVSGLLSGGKELALRDGSGAGNGDNCANERSASGAGIVKDSVPGTPGGAGPHLGAGKQHSAKLNGSTNGQHPASGQVSSQQQQQPNGPSISAPESLFRTGRPEGSEAISTREQGTLCSSVGIVTEPDSLGVCEPGTSVLLEGIVWQETEGGVLVVNVTWRGKTYVGTLLDATRHDWAPPRLTDESEERNRSLGFGGRTKRTGQTRTLSGSEDNNLSKLRNGKGRRSFTPVPASPGKCASPVAADSPKVKKPMSEQQDKVKDKESATGQQQDRERDGGGSSDKESSSSGAGGSSKSGGGSGASGRVTRVMAEDEDALEEASMLECPEPACHKRFKQLNGLRYHQTHAHNDRTPPPPTTIQAPTQSGAESSARTGDQPALGSNNKSTSSESGANVRKEESNDKEHVSSATCDSNTTSTTSNLHSSNSQSALASVDSHPATNKGPAATNASCNDITQKAATSSADVVDKDVSGNAPSPAYSDISDDNNQPNATTTSTTASATTTTTTSTASSTSSTSTATSTTAAADSARTSIQSSATASPSSGPSQLAGGSSTTACGL
ncbi:zinc finger-like, partial [Tropilaelaps mercedesae]